jgi:hypothetical protein
MDSPFDKSPDGSGEDRPKENDGNGPDDPGQGPFDHHYEPEEPLEPEGIVRAVAADLLAYCLVQGLEDSESGSETETQELAEAARRLELAGFVFLPEEPVSEAIGEVAAELFLGAIDPTFASRAMVFVVRKFAEEIIYGILRPSEYGESADIGLKLAGVALYASQGRLSECGALEDVLAQAFEWSLPEEDRPTEPPYPIDTETEYPSVIYELRAAESELQWLEERALAYTEPAPPTKSPKTKAGDKEIRIRRWEYTHRVSLSRFTVAYVLLPNGTLLMIYFIEQGQ